MMNPAINAFQSLVNVHLTNWETTLIQCRPMVCRFGVHSLWWMNNTLTLTWCYCGDQGRSALATRYPTEKKFCYWSWLANCQWRVERLQCSNKNNVFFCTSTQHSLVVNPLRKKDARLRSLRCQWRKVMEECRGIPAPSWICAWPCCMTTWWRSYFLDTMMSYNNNSGEKKEWSDRVVARLHRQHEWLPWPLLAETLLLLYNDLRTGYWLLNQNGNSAPSLFHSSLRKQKKLNSSTSEDHIENEHDCQLVHPLVVDGLTG